MSCGCALDSWGNSWSPHQSSLKVVVVNFVVEAVIYTVNVELDEVEGEVGCLSRDLCQRVHGWYIELSTLILKIPTLHKCLVYLWMCLVSSLYLKLSGFIWWKAPRDKWGWFEINDVTIKNSGSPQGPSMEMILCHIPKV